jgi:hypothetical protein
MGTHIDAPAFTNGGGLVLGLLLLFVIFLGLQMRGQR